MVCCLCILTATINSPSTKTIFLNINSAFISFRHRTIQIKTNDGFAVFSLYCGYSFNPRSIV